CPNEYGSEDNWGCPLPGDPAQTTTDPLDPAPGSDPSSSSDNVTNSESEPPPPATDQDRRELEPINNRWAEGNTVYLCWGTLIRVGSGSSYPVHTRVLQNR